MSELGTELIRRNLIEAIGVPTAGAAPLTILAAPLGCGKTTLLRQWKASLDPHLQVEWVDGADLSPAQCEQVILDWEAGLAEPSVLVIDDFHAVSTADLEATILRIAEANQHAHFVVAGRRFLFLDTPLAMNRVDNTVIRSVDLAFSRAEVTELFQKSGVSPTETNLSLAHMADGWVGALAAVFGPIARESPEEAHKSLGESVQGLLDVQGNRLILLVLSLTGGTTRRALQEVTGYSLDVLDDALQQLEDMGLVRTEWRGISRFHTLHPITLASKRVRSQAALTAEERGRALRAHSRELAALDVVGGLALLLENALFEEAEEFVNTHFLRLYVQPERTYPLLVPLPDEKATRMPMAAAMRLILGQGVPEAPTSEIAKWATQARDAVLATQPMGAQEMDTTYLTLLVACHRILGAWAETEALMQVLESRLASHHSRNKWEKWSTLPLSYAILALTALLLGDFNMAERATRLSVKLAASEKNPAEQVRTNNLHALALALRGQMSEAQRHLDASKEITELTGADASEVNRSNAALAQAAIHLANNDLEAGLDALKWAEPLLNHMEAWGEFVTVESWLLRFNHGHFTALEQLQRRVGQRDKPLLSPRGLARLAATTADLSIQSGNLLQAQEFLFREVLQTDEVVLAKSRLAFAQGDLRQAYELASSVLRSPFAATKSVAAGLLAAAALFEAGEETSALSELSYLDLQGETFSPIILATVPYDPLKGLAKAASNSGRPELLKALNRMPRSHRFQASEPLTPAEHRTLRAVASGRTNQEVAASLGISINTVKAQLRGVYRKLGVSCRSDLIQAATMRGLL